MNGGVCTYLEVLVVLGGQYLGVNTSLLWDVVLHLKVVLINNQLTLKVYIFEFKLV